MTNYFGRVIEGDCEYLAVVYCRFPDDIGGSDCYWIVPGTYREI